MRLTEELRESRLRELHGKFLAGAEHDNPLRHVAAYSDDPLVLECLATSSTESNIWRNIAQRAGFDIYDSSLLVARHRLVIGGNERVGVLASTWWESSDHPETRAKTFAHCARLALHAFGFGGKKASAWLELLYSTLPDDVVTDQTIPVSSLIQKGTWIPLCGCDPPESVHRATVAIAFLKSDVFFTSAHAIETLLEREPQEPQKISERLPAKIPPEERTIPLSYRRAAGLMGKGKSKDAAEWLSASVKDGSIRCESINRQNHVFSKLDFPKGVWPQILPESDEKVK